LEKEDSFPVLRFPVLEHNNKHIGSITLLILSQKSWRYLCQILSKLY